MRNSNPITTTFASGEISEIVFTGYLILLFTAILIAI